MGIGHHVLTLQVFIDVQGLFSCFMSKVAVPSVALSMIRSKTLLKCLKNDA